LGFGGGLLCLGYLGFGDLLDGLVVGLRFVLLNLSCCRLFVVGSFGAVVLFVGFCGVGVVVWFWHVVFGVLGFSCGWIGVGGVCLVVGGLGEGLVFGCLVGCYCDFCDLYLFLLFLWVVCFRVL